MHLIRRCIIHYPQLCRENKSTSPPLSESVNLAKNWYESAFPGDNSNSSISTNASSSINNPIDYSQHVKPDWAHNVSYKRHNKDVIEIPIDPANRILSALKNKNTGKLAYVKENSKSSFVILNDGKSYQAFIMTIFADPSYIGNDLTKLNNNSYAKHDSTFSGMVFILLLKENLFRHTVTKMANWYLPQNQEEALQRAVNSGTSTN
ncbi:hypothetical protein [Mucilaginibacter boryungensis]|uniref:Uncharacterized protein n=1 Tax=Mucilaginibacter boryungensis TaxID=768480 RepID=A0ABR9XCR5_9SPHI|nr:hypothetical protein [Mucilaginibacter boryungensis]MBE9665193.1 hypothetical protein [Mucilaginibacter boryungensis]